MTETRKINVLLVSLALAIAMLVASSSRAEACGGYGDPGTFEAEWAVRDDFWEAHGLASDGSGPYLQILDTTVIARRLALVEAEIVTRDGAGEETRRSVSYALVRVKNEWRVTDSKAATLLVAGLQHALDADIQAALDESHDTVQLGVANLKL